VSVGPEDEAGPSRPHRISRRDLIRAGAVASGTLLWASPVMKTTTAPAFADSLSPVPSSGCNYRVWLDFPHHCSGLRGTNLCTPCTEVQHHDEDECKRIMVCHKPASSSHTPNHHPPPPRNCYIFLALADPHHRSCDQCAPSIPQGFACP
jgi:hypothetical protein